MIFTVAATDGRSRKRKNSGDAMIKAAVVGLGWWGQHMVRRNAGSEHIKIVTAVETNPERAAFAVEHGLA